MKISGAKIWLTTLHTHEPFKIAFEVLDRCHGILLELSTDEGIAGHGEAAPVRRITGETHETAASILKNALIPAVGGADPLDLPGIHALMDGAVFGNPSAKAAVDLACYDILGKKSGKPVAELLGGKPGSLPTDYTVGIKPPKEQAAEAEKWVRQEFRILKIKLGAEPDEDIERVKAIRNRVGEDIVLRVDANQGWSVEDALTVLEKIAPFKIELAEQPVPWHDLDGMARLKKRSPVKIAADESVHSPRDARRAVEMEACDILNIKLMKCGGIHPALEIAAVAEKAGLSCMIGGMIAESRLAVSAAAHFAISQPVVRYYDLDADLLLRDDLLEEGGIGLSGGRRIVPDFPGFGVSRFRPELLTPL